MTGVAPVYSIDTTMCIYFESTLTTYLDKQTRNKEGYFLKDSKLRKCILFISFEIS